jgi:hypothetical protein
MRDGSTIFGLKRWKISKPAEQSRSMKSSATSKFWRAYRLLPPEIRAEANKAYRLWTENPRHPSLRFERKGPYWSVRITRGWRGSREIFIVY